MESSVRTKSLVEGALMAALTAILALAGIYLPFLRILTNLIWTIPIVLVTVRHGLKIGIMSTIVAGFLIFSLSTPLEALFLVLQFGGLALVYGYAFQRGLKPGYTLLAGTGVAIISFVLVFFLSLWVTGLEPNSIQQEMKASIEPTIEMYRSMGIFERYGAQGLTEESMRQMLSGFIDMFSLMIPAILITYGLLAAFLNYLVAQKILLRLKTPVPALPAFRYWRLPWWVIWGFILGLGASLAGSYWNNKTLSVTGSNIMLIYTPVLFLLGSSVISYFFRTKLQGAFVYRMLLIFFVVFFFNYAMTIIPAIGLFDLVFNYRRLPEEG